MCVYNGLYALRGVTAVFYVRLERAFSSHNVCPFVECVLVFLLLLVLIIQCFSWFVKGRMQIIFYSDEL